ncbi:PA0069 family radical SAM protein [Methylobacterium sp. Leaf399]|uniref:PA0069 family radical SAM protein n=1 Tax=Methylobacterium sp. Leaf399 TaxID=1736364 RepID=UPI000AB6D155|nr:PA0069 family radical SAM protein [Methylobacterium sp. Leaf399]
MTAAARTFKGRGATVNPDGRYEAARHEAFDDGWGGDEAPSAPRAEVLRAEVLRTEVLRTEVLPEAARSIITRNTSPDIAFDRSINPYRGCEHGCVYCFARPNHAYVGLSPGLDFETRLFTKPDAARLLERELAAPGYRPATIALGTATDPYQPIERTHRLTRQVLEVLARDRHPVGIVTKSNLVTRDIDILSDMAAMGLVKVAMSVTTLDPALARRMEPRAPHPERRLDAIRQLTAAGIPVLVMVAPIIPSLNDHDIEAILARARDCGAMEARHVLLRLPLELDDLVGDWLRAHYPGKKRHVMSLVRQARGGKAYDAAFGRRMTGAGPYAELIAERMRLARKRLGYRETRVPLRTDLFVRPSRDGAQLSLL